MRKFFILLILLSLFSIWPFLKKGYFESHDGEWMVIRFSAFHQTLRAGQFPVRFVDRLNNNFGYPVINFLYPLPFYLSEIPKVAGFNFVDSVKIIFVFSTVFSTVAMYWALRQLFSKEASIVGSTLYLYAPYRFVDLYVRGSIGENVAFAVIPLILGSIFKISKGENIYLPILALASALLVLAHNVIAILCLPVLVIFSLLLIGDQKLKIIGTFLLGILISTFFWLPAVYDLQYVRMTNLKISNIQDHLVSVRNLIIPSWGYGPALGGEGLSVQFGIVTVAIFLASIYLQLVSKKKSKTIIFMLSVFLASFLLMTKSALIFWKNVPYVDVIQFPWRLLSLIVFISALLAAFTVNSIKRNRLAAAVL